MVNLVQMAQNATSPAQGWMDTRASQGMFGQINAGVNDFFNSLYGLQQNQEALKNVHQNYLQMAQYYQSVLDDPKADSSLKMGAAERIYDLGNLVGTSNISNIGNFGENYGKLVKSPFLADMKNKIALQGMKNEATLGAARIGAGARVEAAKAYGEASRANKIDSALLNHFLNKGDFQQAGDQMSGNDSMFGY